MVAVFIRDVTTSLLPNVAPHSLDTSTPLPSQSSGASTPLPSQPSIVHHPSPPPLPTRHSSPPPLPHRPSSNSSEHITTYYKPYVPRSREGTPAVDSQPPVQPQMNFSPPLTDTLYENEQAEMDSLSPNNPSGEPPLTTQQKLIETFHRRVSAAENSLPDGIILRIFRSGDECEAEGVELVQQIMNDLRIND